MEYTVYRDNKKSKRIFILLYTELYFFHSTLRTDIFGAIPPTQEEAEPRAIKTNCDVKNHMVVCADLASRSLPSLPPSLPALPLVPGGLF